MKTKPLKWKIWSIFSDNVRSIQHDEKDPTQVKLQYPRLLTTQRALLQVKRRGKQTLDIGFGVNFETLKINYLDLYEDVQAEMIYTNRFDENSNLSTTYLGQTKNDKGHENQSRSEISITRQGFTSGKLLDGTACQILLDTGAT